MTPENGPETRPPGTKLPGRTTRSGSKSPVRATAMSSSLYERYKDALRRGHVAALRGRNEAAIEAYKEAAAIAPDRALPHASIGGILVKLNRPADAVAAYEAALALAPGDEAALRGIAETLTRLGRRPAVAAALDRLATTLEMGGRIGDATDAARRALELEQTTERRARLADLVERLERLSPADDDAERALVDARNVLQVAEPELERDAEASAIETDAARPADGDGVDLELADADENAIADADAADPGMREVEAEGAGHAPDLAEDEPEPITEPPGLGIALGAAAEAHFYAGELGEAHAGLLAAARAHRRAGRPVAAIDACYLAIGLAPSDPELHLLLTEIYLDQGWPTLATDKLVLLSRLADLDEDAATRERLCGMVAARLAHEPRAQELCA